MKSTMDNVRMILTRTFGSLDRDTEGALIALNSALDGQREKVERSWRDQLAKPPKASTKGKKGMSRKRRKKEKVA